MKARIETIKGSQFCFKSMPLLCLLPSAAGQLGMQTVFSFKIINNTPMGTNGFETYRPAAASAMTRYVTPPAEM